MNTLRAKLIALLVIANLSVVALATWLTYLTLGSPEFGDIIRGNAAQIGLLLKQRPLTGDDSVMPAIGFQDSPAGGAPLSDFTADLRAELARTGLPADAIITRPPGSPWPVVSLSLPGEAGVLVVPASVPPPPPNIYPRLIGWIILITVGAAAVSVAAVYRLTQPLVLVERSIANVDAEGELPVLPETGPTEVRVTAMAINRLSARLKQAMASRMRLVAAAGHDLRTPMTRMRLRAEFLDDHARAKWLADIDELDHIADSAISLVREEMAEDDCDPTQLDVLLREAVDELSDLGMELTLRSVTPAEVAIRPLSLKRALRNLLVNAATYGKGATITLSKFEATAKIEIVDRGEGIPDELLKRATEPFFRVDPARSSTGGAGLGLAIASEIISRNGGQLTLANSPLGGLIQTIALPIHA